MCSSSHHAQVVDIARKIGLAGIRGDWMGVDVVWPLLEKMRQEGAVVVIKLDGLRQGVDDNGPYTIVISGGKLGAEFVHSDAHDIETGLAYGIVHYAEKCW